SDHYLALAELAYPERSKRGLTWARMIDEERDNLRAALDDLRAGDPLRYLQLAGALGWFWQARSHFEDGAPTLEEALAATGEDGPLTARALTYCGALDANRGRVEAPPRRLQEAVSLLQAVGGGPAVAAA